MKKLLVVILTAVCFIGTAFAQENAGGSDASNSASGSLNKNEIIAGAVGFGLVGALIANNRGSAKELDPPPPSCDEGEKLEDGVCVPVDPTDPVCEDGEELVDGVCVPVTTTTTQTTPTTVTSTNVVTNTVTVTTTN